MDIDCQNELIGLTVKKASSTMKKYIESIPDRKKGRVFEWYLAELFKGNGWLIKLRGGRNDMGADILLYHPKIPMKVSLIVQAKNWLTPLSFDDTKIELIKFEEKGFLTYDCNQYQIVSVMVPSPLPSCLGCFVNLARHFRTSSDEISRNGLSPR